MKKRYFTLSLLATLTLGLTACSKGGADGSNDNSAIAQAQAYEAMAKQAKGFTVGSLMSTQPVYVLFDPQCPHCAHLWNATLPLLGKVKFVWVPVSILGPKSLPQAAALLQAADPVAAMTAHEQSVLAGSGGMSASSRIPDEVEAAIKANNKLLDRLGADSVPFIVARYSRNGQSITNAGSLSTAALSGFLGLSQP